MSYVVALKHLTGRCEFGTFLDEELRDRLVSGLRYEAIQKRLLSEKKLIFQQAAETAHAMELAAKNAVEFTGRMSSEALQVHNIGATRKKGSMKVQPSKN